MCGTRYHSGKLCPSRALSWLNLFVLSECHCKLEAWGWLAERTVVASDKHLLIRPRRSIRHAWGTLSGRCSSIDCSPLLYSRRLAFRDNLTSPSQHIKHC
jgi:hypothetical protein